MIRRLQVQHRHFWAVGAIVIPALVVLALLLRSDPPVERELPEALAATASEGSR